MTVTEFGSNEIYWDRGGVWGEEGNFLILTDWLTDDDDDDDDEDDDDVTISFCMEHYIWKIEFQTWNLKSVALHYTLLKCKNTADNIKTWIKKCSKNILDINIT